MFMLTLIHRNSQAAMCLLASINIVKGFVEVGKLYCHALAGYFDNSLIRRVHWHVGRGGVSGGEEVLKSLHG